MQPHGNPYKRKKTKQKKLKRAFWFSDFHLYGTKKWVKQFGKVKKTKGSFLENLNRVFEETKAANKVAA